MTDQTNSFDQWALTYDDDVQKADESDDWMFTGYYGVLDKIVDYCEINTYDNPSILDIGAGTGNLSAKILEKVMNITAIDPSEKMREICRCKCPSIKVLEGDFLDIPLPPQSIDVIVSSYTFHHLTPDEKETSISLMKMLLKPKGRIVIADLMFKNPSVKESIIRKLEDSSQSEKIEEIEE